MELQPEEVLFIPKRKRMTHSRVKSEAGQDVLHLFYGEIELIFDEPDIAPMGEKLLAVERFRADEAMTWSNAEPHSWERVRELLESLLEVNMLKRASQAAAPASATATYPARLGLAPEDREPRTYSGADAARCPMHTQEGFGHAVDLGNLEVLVPIYRVAHPALDTDGRQVGENNVTPRTLFLDLPAQRKLCQYPGSRYQNELPMNQTALKHMSKRWPELLSLSEQMRTAVTARMPPRDPAALQAGELHFHAVCQLAAVGYVMVRGVDPTPNGQLDGGLAAMFRLIDGVRLVTNDILRHQEHQHGCEVPVTAQTILDWAERYAVYNGNFGVCAGPPGLIEEYVRTLVGELAAPIQAEPSVGERLGDLEAAIDYGLLGQRVECIVRYAGSAQGLLHDRLRQAFVGHTTGTRLQELVEAPITSATYSMLREDYPLVSTFKLEMSVSRWLFGRAGEALPGKVDGASLDEIMQLDRDALAAAAGALGDLFAAALPDPALAPICRELAAVTAEVFAIERRALRAVGATQAKLNERIQRAPGRPLTGLDLVAYNRPRTGPPLASVLADGLGVTVTGDAHATVVRHGDRSLTFTD
ncbi:MAG TPA: hypothetical protein VFP84_38490 [Kofleriaceae bacterium]|nr:hypothetical protein [Kofleriaceae bacterium]